MDRDKVDLLLLQKGKFFPSLQLMAVREMLVKTDEEKWLQMYSTSFKDPFWALLLSLAAGTSGADRFYLGQVRSGVVKLLLTFFVTISLVLFSLTENLWLGIIGLCALFAMVAWYVVDISRISSIAREQNMNTLLTILNTNTHGCTES